MQRLSIDLSSKRVQVALRFFTYGVMAVSTAVLTAGAIFYAMGYRFNQNLTVEQGGLVQLRSLPEGAQVFVDGKDKGVQTPGRAYVEARSHTIEMRLSGYRTWQRTVDVAPGQLLWLDYTRFWPNDIKTTSLKTFPAINYNLQSPDRRWIMLQEQANNPTFTLADVSNEKQPVFTPFTIPDAMLTKKDGHIGNLTLLEWDLGSRYLLVRHDNGDVHELLRLDRNKAADAVNISQVMRLNIGEAHFAGSNSNVLYAQTGDVLRRLDISGASVSGALAIGLKKFVVYGDDRLAYVAERELEPGAIKQVVGIYQGGKETLVRTYPANISVQIALTEYFRHQYLAVNQGDTIVEVIRDPLEVTKDSSASTVKFALDQPVSWLKFSASGRMVVAGNGSSWATHDLEVDKTYQSKFNDVVVTTPLQWLDDFYLYTTAGGKLRIVEFDGQNGLEVANTTDGLTIGLSQNNKSLFSVGVSQNGQSLQASRLVNE